MWAGRSTVDRFLGTFIEMEEVSGSNPDRSTLLFSMDNYYIMVSMEDEEEPVEESKDVKLAEFKLKESAVLVIKKTNYKGEDRIDFRVWLNSAKYKGPTKQGFQLRMNQIDDFIEAVDGMKKKLKEAEKQ